MSASLGLDIALVTAGLILVFLVWVMLRLLPRNQTSAQVAPPAQKPLSYESSTDAVLIVQSGGRVEYLSDLAREWFALGDTEPAELERLTRRVRPVDDFLEVCAAPGRKRLTVNGKLLEATSYQVPGQYPLVLVSLRSLNLAPELEASGEAAGAILKTVTEFSQAVAASLDLESTLGSILNNISRLIPADFIELKVWDAASQSLVPYRFRGTGTGSHVLVRASRSQFSPLTDQLVSERQPLILTGSQIAPEELSARIQSYLGVPLLAGGELVGTLEAGQMGSAAFGQHDLDLLRFVSGQAAIAIRHALLYEEEERRASELAGLADLTQAVSAIQDPKDLFGRLVESVAPLFEAEILGFLMFDENRHILEGQIPFRGLPVHIMELFRVPIPADSPAEQLLLQGKLLLTMDASQDADWHTLGLDHVAMAASLRDSALVPLLSGRRTVGYLQVSHHRAGTALFTAEELRLMNIVANQAATIIENAQLVQESRSRAQRSDALRYIASLSASSATLDEVLRYSLQELAHIYQADAGAIFILEQERGQLTLHRESVWGVAAEVADAFGALLVDDPNYLLTVTHSLDPFLSGRLSADRRTLPMYGPLARSLSLESALVVPLVAREHSLGELMLGSAKTEHFSAYDLQVLTTAAGQLASAIEASKQLGQTDDSLRQRVQQLTDIARVSWQLGASLDAKHILDVIHDEALRLTGADCGSVLLLDGGKEDTAPFVRLAVG